MNISPELRSAFEERFVAVDTDSQLPTYTEHPEVLLGWIAEREALAERRGEENKIRNVWKFGEEHEWNNQVMTDIRNFLSYGIDLTPPRYPS